jgi:lipid II:glycine glycyltransferase (peptidoglycan interpeptide bridge formation enzyme)
MKIVEIKKNQKEVWNEFIAENNSESFLQSWEWGEFQKSLGRKIWRIGVIQNSKFIAVALIVKYDLLFGRSYLYCPRGPVIGVSSIKYQVSSIFDFLFSEIKKIAEKEKSLFLRIDPPTSLTPALSRGEREPAPPFKKRAGGISSLIFKKSLSEVQPKNTLILDITKSEEELLKEMKQKTRYNIRLAERKELRIKNYELGIDNKEKFKEKFDEFWKLVKETSKRDKFKSHSKNYYWKMLESLATTLLTPTLSRVEREYAPLTSIPKQNLQAKLYLAEYNNKIIAANVVLFFGDMAVYLHGASSNEHRNLMAPYLLQWRQITDAKKIGCKKYDFWGISPMVRQAHYDNNVILSLSKDEKNKKSDWQGITRFKKGFGGEEKNYIGAYDMVFDSIGYAIYRLMKSIKSKVHKVKSLFCKK